MKKLIIIHLFFLSLLALSNKASAEKTTNWLSNLNLGTYSSAGLTVDKDAPTSLAINELSFWINTITESRWQFFTELEIEQPLAWDEQEKFNTNGAAINVERLYLDYNLSEKVNVRAGRFLTPNSRWNLLHAAPLVWTSTRPMATNWLFPIRTSGIMVFGALPVMDAALEYNLFSEVLQDQKNSDQGLRFDNVNGARLSLKKDIAELGLSAMSFKEKGLNKHYYLFGLDFYSNINNIEVSVELFQRFQRGNTDGGSGGYVQTAVPLNKLGATNWFWITRLEAINRPAQGASNRWLLGATWRIKPRRLLKFEFTGGQDPYQDAPRGFLTSFALFF